jgi:hypothetical protein
MSDLVDIQEKLQDTVAMLTALESDLARHPNTPALLLNYQSIEKRKRKLEAELSAAASALGLEVCSYRIIPDGERVKVAGLTSAIGEYQSLVSIFYDAVKNGAKQIAALSAEAIRDTSFDFAYAFAGSVGFVFTLPNERTMFDNTHLDEAIRLIFEVSKAEKPSDILRFARKLGPAPIRVLYRWTESHVRSSFSAEIQWKRGSDIRQSMLIQGAEFQRLQQMLIETSDDTREELVVQAELVGADITRKTFHLRMDQGPDIRGRFANAIGHSHTVELPKHYRATITKTTRIRYSTEEPEVLHELLNLEPI